MTENIRSNVGYPDDADDTADIIKRLKQRSLIAIIESIFGQLDAQELQNAEVVSKAWYEAVRGSSAKLWKNLLERKMNQLPMWGTMHNYFQPDLQLQVRDELYHKKLYHMIQHSVKKLGDNWQKPSDLTTDFIDCQNGETDVSFRMTEKYLAIWIEKTSVLKIWSRHSLKLVEVIKGPSIKWYEGENFAIYEDALVYAACDQITVRNLVNKSVITHKLDGQLKGKFIFGIHTEHGHLCAKVAQKVVCAQRRRDALEPLLDRPVAAGEVENIAIWKFKGPGEIDWDACHVVSSPSYYYFCDIFVDREHIVLMKTKDPTSRSFRHFRADILSVDGGYQKINSFKFYLESRFSCAQYKDGHLILTNSQESEFEISAIDVKSGVARSIIKHDNDFCSVGAYMRVNSKHVILSSPESGSYLRVQVWDFQKALTSKLPIEENKPLFSFNAFLDYAEYLHLDDFGLVGVLRTEKMHTFSIDNFYWFHVLDFLPKCGGCKHVSKKLKRCSRCKMVKYCSTGCQRSDWIHHKGLCRDYANHAKRLEGDYDFSDDEIEDDF